MRSRPRVLRMLAFALLAPAIFFGLITFGVVRAVRTNTQLAADAGALAAAGYLLSRPGDYAGARQEAVRFVMANTVFGRAPQVDPEKITFDRETTRVDVHARTRLILLPDAFFRWTGTREIFLSATGSAEGGVAGVNSPVVRALKLSDEEAPGKRKVSTGR